MALKQYECPACGGIKKTLSKEVPTCNHGQTYIYDSSGQLGLPPAVMELIITAPSSKMMETTDSFKGKSRMKDQTKILKERARNYSRDHEADDLISLNQRNSLTRSGFLTKEGRKRKKADDL